MASYAFQHDLTDGALTDDAAIAWALGVAEDGDVLIEYEETGLSHEQDPGSRCGLSDPALDQIRRWLRSRDLLLVATDTGLEAMSADRAP